MTRDELVQELEKIQVRLKVYKDGTREYRAAKVTEGAILQRLKETSHEER